MGAYQDSLQMERDQLMADLAAERQARQQAEQRVARLTIERDDFENQVDENIRERDAAEQRADKATADVAAMRAAVLAHCQCVRDPKNGVAEWSHTAAIMEHAAESTDTGRELAALVERLRAAPCEQLRPSEKTCLERWPGESGKWCFTCQARAIGGGE